VGTGALARPSRAKLGSFLPLDKRIPIRKRLSRRDSNLRHHHDYSHRRQISQRINFLAAPHSQRRSADQEKWQIGPHLGGNPQSNRSRQLPFQSPLQRNQGCHRIRRRRTQPSLHRQPLLDFDVDSALSAEFVHHALGHPIAGIRRIQRNSCVGTHNLNPTATPDADPDHIMQRDRLVNRAQIVISVRARTTDVESEINLRK